MGDVEQIGRPMRVLSRRERKQVGILAEYLTQEQIAAHLSISVDTLTRIFQRDEKVGSLYLRGKAKAIADIASNLVQKAKGGDFQSQKFFLQTQAGWSETVHLTSPDGSMTPKDRLVAIYALPDNGRDKQQGNPSPDPAPKAKATPRRKAATKRKAATRKPATGKVKSEGKQT